MSEYFKELKHTTEEEEKASIRLAKRHIDGPIYTAEQLVDMAFAEYPEDKIAVCWSGGRCSTVVLHMALKHNSNVKVFWNNHGVHFPRTVRYVKRMSKEWDLNLYEGKPDRSFWDICEEYGFPKARRPQSKDGKKKSRNVPKCCQYLKDEPLRDFIQEYDIEANITGMRVSEAKVRMMTITQKKAQHYFHKTDNVYKIHPILLWTTRQVTEWLENHDIPINPIYEKQDRTGCWPCSAYLGWEENLMETNYELYEFLMEKRGGSKQRLLEHFEETRVRPCSGRG